MMMKWGGEICNISFNGILMVAEHTLVQRMS